MQAVSTLCAVIGHTKSKPTTIMKDQKLLTILVIFTLLFSIASFVISLLVLNRNFMRDELLQAMQAAYFDPQLVEEELTGELIADELPAQPAEQQADQQQAGLQPTAQQAKPSEQVQQAAAEATEQVAQEPSNIVKGDVFVDMGLPSGTLWKGENEEGLPDFDSAKKKYKKNLPTIKQWKELRKYCQWEWTGDGYQVIGPNGTGIFLPAAGYRNYSGQIGKVGTYGNYWSSTVKDAEESWRFGFEPDKFSMAAHSRTYGRSIRLVQKPSILSEITDATD